MQPPDRYAEHGGRCRSGRTNHPNPTPPATRSRSVDVVATVYALLVYYDGGTHMASVCPNRLAATKKKEKRQDILLYSWGRVRSSAGRATPKRGSAVLILQDRGSSVGTCVRACVCRCVSVWVFRSAFRVSTVASTKNLQAEMFPGSIHQKYIISSSFRFQRKLSIT